MEESAHHDEAGDGTGHAAPASNETTDGTATPVSIKNDEAADTADTPGADSPPQPKPKATPKRAMPKHCPTGRSPLPKANAKCKAKAMVTPKRGALAKAAAKAKAKVSPKRMARKPTPKDDVERKMHAVIGIQIDQKTFLCTLSMTVFEYLGLFKPLV